MELETLACDTCGVSAVPKTFDEINLRCGVAATNDADRVDPALSVESAEGYCGELQVRALKTRRRFLAERAKVERASPNTLAVKLQAQALDECVGYGD